MKTSIQSILLAVMLAASGFAAAQSTVAPPDGAQIKNPAMGKTTENTRSDVKAQINTRDTAANTQAQGPMAKAPPTGNSENSRASVKAEIGNKATPRVVQAQGPSAETNVPMTAAERKAKRDERRAMAKAKRAAKAS